MLKEKNHDERIRFLFEPRSVAIIGASHDRGKIGFAVLRNILSGGYCGAIYPINPAGGEIEGIPVRRSLQEVEGEIDVAVVTIPSPLVFAAVQDLCRHNVKNAILISAGFSEIGNLEEERKITDYANEHGMRILGPNVFGIYSSSSNLNATFVSGNIPRGHLAMITQSGALGLTLVGQASVEHIGLSAIVSVGNKSDIDESDLLDYLYRHEETHMVLIYIEGIRNGEKFIAALKKTTRVKPVVIIKSGRSQRGAMAAASHTGSLAGSDDLFDAIARQCGALRAESTREAFNWCKFITNNPLPRGENTVIITNGGGAGVMATDACEKYSVPLYDDAEDLKQIFTPVIPSFGSAKNPVDVTGNASLADYTKAFDAALQSENINTVVGIFCETAIVPADHLKEMVETNVQRYRQKGKLIIFSLFGGEKTSQYEMEARRRGLPVTDDVYDAISTLGAGYRYNRYAIDLPDEEADVTMDFGAIDEIVRNAAAAKRYFLLAHEAQKIMEIADIPIPVTMNATTLEAAITSADSVGYPVAMKVISKDIIHKSDAGGIALGLDNRKEVVAAYEAIMRNCRAHVPHAVIEGVSISEMVRPGVEIIIGARRDVIFGPTVMVGLGGIYVEVMKDVSFRALPLDQKEIQTMVKEIRSYPLLLGVRGEAMKDINKLVEAIIKISAIIRRCKGITDIEINPLVVYEVGMGAKAVDVRILLSKG
ncbi:MAG: acetate--CoA ligase family protein [Deltaproteobacteria bacterium]